MVLISANQCWILAGNQCTIRVGNITEHPLILHVILRIISTIVERVHRFVIGTIGCKCCSCQIHGQIKSLELSAQINSKIEIRKSALPISYWPLIQLIDHFIPIDVFIFYISWSQGRITLTVIVYIVIGNFFPGLKLSSSM